MAVTTSGRLIAHHDDRSRDGTCIVRLHGELDIGNHELVERACVAHGGAQVVVDLSGLTFLSCSGYGALVSARRTLEAQNGSLRLRSERGQPGRLIALIAEAARRRVEKHEPRPEVLRAGST